jgi:hypothetical protein
MTDDVCSDLSRSIEYAQEFATGSRSDLFEEPFRLGPFHGRWSVGRDAR